MKQYYFSLRHGAHDHININNRRGGSQKKENTLFVQEIAM